MAALRIEPLGSEAALYARRCMQISEVILCATENEKSCAVAERLGFRREGVRRQAAWLYDRFVDLVSYSTLASEWPTRHS